jgi:SAM-dependent methyltransferase
MRDFLRMQSAWTQYWNAGYTESMPEDRAAGRLVELDSAWNEFFSAFPDRAKLLDLATGGGDVIRAAIAVGRNFDLTGVDLADLSAVSAGFQPGRVALIGNTDLSTLPFADGSFDGATSQFGIEYADIAAATREAIRVLAPGGRGRFLLHHADSAITQAGAERLKAHRAVFSHSRAFQRGRELFELHQLAAPRAAIVEAEAEFRAVVSALQQRLKNQSAFATAHKIVNFLTELATAPTLRTASDALHRLDEEEGKIQASNLRRRAQIDAALDRNGMDKFVQLLTNAGAVVDAPRELKHANGRVLAWSCSFCR